MGRPGPRNLSCVSYKHPSVRGGLGGAGGAAAGAVRCPPGQCCIGIWNRSHALVQGCWGGGGGRCPSPTCTPSPAGPPGGAVLVCLCHGHLCNGNTTATGTGTGTGTAVGLGGAPPGPVPGRGGSTGTLWLWGAGPLLLILLTCLGILGLRRTRAHTGQPPREGQRIGVPSEPPSPDLPALHFLQVLQSGRFSAVWRGTLRQRPVAIKAFAAGARGRFAAERAVHALPLMEHENVARLLGTRGAGPRARGGLLVLQLYPAGSLRDFLGQHVGTWAGSVRLALSLARGLAFLHQELWRDGLYKPSVVHRDLSSQNVLVREDGTCAIGDFGLALALPPRAQDGTGARHAVAIRKAGTQRYLAPEILDESLDLRAWGRALRQADVYALALLLWEILSRCQALSPGAPVPAFQLAYEAELGSNPTGAQLRRLAADERRRPLIPPAWHQAPQCGGGWSHSPGGALPELLEDCWDPDPEARLSAERALQRLQCLAAGPAPPPGDPGPRPPPFRQVPESPTMWNPGAGQPPPPQPRVPPKPHVLPPGATPQPRVSTPRGTLQPSGGARAASVPPWAPPVPHRPSPGPLGPPPGSTPAAPPPWGALPVPPRAGQEGGQEDEEEDEEGSEEAQALFVFLLLLLQQLRLKLLPRPPWDHPGPPRTTWDHPCPPGRTQDPWDHQGPRAHHVPMSPPPRGPKRGSGCWGRPRGAPQ
ncbi:LOW QUALITY PROTEIN: anti-Muellerian hormone type-2 receptor [Manacus candei]|uniref:LOW QUALITY PROTEIN: anti-Muellerian hormone type-2 receptor n=1 Tax=Manacus candei TaxID=415023 RepID=UPI002227EFF1|nr:LOW QUALITY PROTEIN: anti-Muellerian hormone type-2 receptor [Manacus candei]